MRIDDAAAALEQQTADRSTPIPCAACDLNAVCRLTGLIAYDGSRSRQPTGALRTVRTGAALFHAGAPAHAVFAIRQGSVKLVRTTLEGNERIVSVHIAGDVLGLEAFSSEAYLYDAIALEPVQCCELSAPVLNELGPKTPELASALVRLLSRAATTRSELTRGSARERIVNFLIDLSRRYGERRSDPAALKLGLSRLELASLLDVRIETVSRTLQQLHRERAIHVRGDRIRLIDLATEAQPASRG